MKKIFFLLPLLAILSCNRDSHPSENQLDDMFAFQRGQLPSAIQILNILQQPTDGYVALSSYATLSTQAYRGGEIMINGFGYDKSGFKRSFGPLLLGTAVVSPNNLQNPDYLSIGPQGGVSWYGSTIPVTLSGSGNLPGFQTSFYIPKMMTILSPTFSNNTPIAPGTTITWDADRGNQFGVGMALQFDPKSPENRSQNFSQGFVTNLVHTEDDGSYMITSDDLAGIPSGAHLTLHIGRGNYKYVPMVANYNFGLISYSVVDQSFVKQ